VGLTAEGFAIESGLSLDGGFGEQVPEEPVRFVALAACGFEQAAQDGVILQSRFGAGPSKDPAQDDHGAQAAFGLVVSGRDAGTTEAGKEEFLFGAG
jgi:hypothetical protein